MVYSDVLDICDMAPLENVQALVPGFDPLEYDGMGSGVFWHSKETGDGTIKQYRAAHATLTEYVAAGLVTEEQVADYEVYCFLRDPVDRYCSALRHAGATLTKEQIAASYKNGDEMFPGEPRFAWPQETYYYLNGAPACKPLKFEKFDQEVNKVLTKIGAKPLEVVPHLNQRNPNGYTVDDLLEADVKAAVQATYSDDITEWNKLDG
jgi:hypothetical protein